MKQMRKHYVAIVTIIVALSLATLPAMSQILGSVVLSFNGRISNVVYAKSGSAADIQTAVNLANSQGGGTVYIPAGTFAWNGETVNVPGGVNVIGASEAGCQGHEANWAENTATTILQNSRQSTMFNVDGRNKLPTRISGFKINQASGTSAPTIRFDRAKNGRVDHITMTNSGAQPVFLTNTDDKTYTSVLVDHCIFDNQWKAGTSEVWGYGPYAQGPINTNNYNSFGWDTNAFNFFGKWEPTTSMPAVVLYVEDSHLSRMRHAADSIQGGYHVFRYNLVDNPIPSWYQMFDNHGTSAGSYVSSRGFESYGNKFVASPSEDASLVIDLRGGSGLIYDNEIVLGAGSRSYTFVISLDTVNEDAANTLPNTHIRQTYIGPLGDGTNWTNKVTVASGGSYTYFNNPNGYTEGTHYFWTRPSGYTPYTYPHPLTQT